MISLAEFWAGCVRKEAAREGHSRATASRAWKLSGWGVRVRQERRKRKKRTKSQLCRLHKATAVRNGRSKCRGGRARGSRPGRDAARSAASCLPGLGGRGDPTHLQLGASAGAGRARWGWPPHHGANSRSWLGTFPGRAASAAVLTLLNTSRSSSSSSRSSTWACSRAEEPLPPRRGASTPGLSPVAPPAGRPEERAWDARRSPSIPTVRARPAAAASPAPPSVPIGSRASCTSPAGPAPAPRPLRRRGTGGASAGPPRPHLARGLLETRGVGLVGPGEGGERAAVRGRKAERAKVGGGRPHLPWLGDGRAWVSAGAGGLGRSYRANRQLRGDPQAGWKAADPSRREKKPVLYFPYFKWLFFFLVVVLESLFYQG